MGTMRTYKTSKHVAGGKYKCKHCGSKFTADLKNQQVCSYGCAYSYYFDLKNRSRKVAREISHSVGLKSMAEVEFCVNHDDLDFEYETETWDWTPTVKPAKYTPDFVFLKRRGTMYIEFKGKLDLASRKKLVDIKNQHPKKDLRLIFKRPQNFIRKGSKTTYKMWAEKQGFKVAASNKMPEEWRDELR